MVTGVAADLVAYGGASPSLPGVVARPVLHPVHTTGGTLVTAAEPADHPWHRGIGVGLPDVSGVNLWGGPSYRPGAGYAAEHTVHGVVRTAGAEIAADRIEDRLHWCGPDGTVLLAEQRRIDRQVIDGILVLDWRSKLVAARPVSLGSPASHGRPGAGYGGFFWRLPVVAPDAVSVWTARAEGETATNGAVAPWLAIALRTPEPWTAVLRPLDARTAADPWFVRITEYAGVGSGLAAAEPLPLAAGAGLTIGLRLVLSDGSPPVADLLAVGEQR